jgi:hypothetical protein
VIDKKRMTVAELIVELQKYDSTLIVGPYYDYEITGKQGIELWDGPRKVADIETVSSD